MTGTSGAEGFAEFVAARSSGLLRRAWLLTGDAGKAEDLLQTVLAKAWRRWSAIVEGSSPEAYVRKALYTTYVSWWRRRWRVKVQAARALRSLRADPSCGYPVRRGRDVSETNETRIGELLESAVPPLPERPDRVAEVGTRVRRTRLAMGGVAAGAVAIAVALAVAVPAVLTGADRAAPGPAGPGGNLSCPPAVDVRDWTALPPPAAPQGDPLVPRGAVGAMLCEREVIDPARGLRGEVIFAPVLTTDVGQVVEALNLPPVEWGGSSRRGCGGRDVPVDPLYPLWSRRAPLR